MYILMGLTNNCFKTAVNFFHSTNSHIGLILSIFIEVVLEKNLTLIYSIVKIT